jgi:hypothetical protein
MVQAHAAFDGRFSGAAVVVFLVGLAIALEATPLVDVEQGAGELSAGSMPHPAPSHAAHRGSASPAPCAAFPRREEAVLDERAHHACLAFEQAVAAPAHGACVRDA